MIFSTWNELIRALERRERIKIVIHRAGNLGNHGFQMGLGQISQQFLVNHDSVAWTQR
jgi:hypothetical protein